MDNNNQPITPPQFYTNNPVPTPPKKFNKKILVILVLLGLVAIATFVFIRLRYTKNTSYLTYAECMEKTNLPCTFWFVGDLGHEWKPSTYKTKEECEAGIPQVGRICLIPAGNFKETRWISNSDLAGAEKETATVSVNNETANWKTITSYIAQLKYPSNYIDSDTNNDLSVSALSGSFLPSNGDSISYYVIEIPKSEFPNTNLSQAYIVFSATDKINGESECKQYNYQEKTDMTKQVKIGNTTFYTHDHVGVAVGTTSYGDVYRIFYKGVCYELNTWAFSSEISPDHGNTNLSQFDANQLSNDFNSIISTFKFTK